MFAFSYGLLFFLKIINFFLQSNQNFNFIKLIKFSCLIIKDLNSHLPFNLTDNPQYFAIILSLLTNSIPITILYQVDIIFDCLLKYLIFDKPIFMLILRLQNTVAAVASIIFIVFLDGGL